MSTCVTIPTLKTERLVLRAPHWADFEPYAAFCASERTVTVGGPFTRGRAFDRPSSVIGHWQLRGYGRWMVTDGDTGEALGIVGVLYPEGWPEPEIAWSVFDAAEGRGVAYEAAMAARQYVYDTLGWHSIISCVAPENTRSVALAKRMGCNAEGTFEHDPYGTLHIWRHPGAQA